MPAPKVRDLDKTITGFLFHPHFLYGLILLFVFVVSLVSVYFLFRSEEPLFMRIIGCLLFLLAGSEGVINGIKNIRFAWKDWHDYLKE